MALAITNDFEAVTALVIVGSSLYRLEAVRLDRLLPDGIGAPRDVRRVVLPPARRVSVHTVVVVVVVVIVGEEERLGGRIGKIRNPVRAAIAAVAALAVLL